MRTVPSGPRGRGFSMRNGVGYVARSDVARTFRLAGCGGRVGRRGECQLGLSSLHEGEGCSATYLRADRPLRHCGVGSRAQGGRWFDDYILTALTAGLCILSIPRLRRRATSSPSPYPITSLHYHTIGPGVHALGVYPRAPSHPRATFRKQRPPLSSSPSPTPSDPIPSSLRPILRLCMHADPISSPLRQILAETPDSSSIHSPLPGVLHLHILIRTPLRHPHPCPCIRALRENENG